MLPMRRRPPPPSTMMLIDARILDAGVVVAEKAGIEVDTPKDMQVNH